MLVWIVDASLAVWRCTWCYPSALFWKALTLSSVWYQYFPLRGVYSFFYGSVALKRSAALVCLQTWFLILTAMLHSPRLRSDRLTLMCENPHHCPEFPPLSSVNVLSQTRGYTSENVCGCSNVIYTLLK